MQIIIKVLNGKDCIITATPATTILNLKEEIERMLNIPQANQKLLLLGRTLNDEQALSSYPTIRDGSKLNLIVKKAESCRDIVYKMFRKHYNEQHSEQLAKVFLDDLEAKLEQLSFDDLERLVDSINSYS